MSRLSPYVNEIVGFIIMLLMLIALIAGIQIGRAECGI
jgi:hypothetical protein